jgi:hypothetical protein
MLCQSLENLYLFINVEVRLLRATFAVKFFRFPRSLCTKGATYRTETNRKISMASFGGYDRLHLSWLRFSSASFGLLSVQMVPELVDGLAVETQLFGNSVFGKSLFHPFGL